MTTTPDRTKDETQFAQLTAFKRDIIVAVLRKGGKPESDADHVPYGLGIKRELEDLRGEEVNHGRLYPNLDDLIDAGFLDKHEKDKRTNGYQATAKAVDTLAAYLSNYVGVDDVAGSTIGETVETNARRQRSAAPADD